MFINMLANTILKEFIAMILFLQMKMLLKVNKFTKKLSQDFQMLVLMFADGKQL